MPRHRLRRTASSTRRSSCANLATRGAYRRRRRRRRHRVEQYLVHHIATTWAPRSSSAEPGFGETLRLVDLGDGPSLIFVDCVFERGVCARDAVMGRSLTFVDCEIRSLSEKSASDIAVDLENARVGGDLGLLYDCRIGGRFFATTLDASSDVRLRGCRIAPQIGDIGERVRFDELGTGADDVGVDLLGKLLDRLHWSASGFAPLSAVCLDGATIKGNLEIGLTTSEPRKTSSSGRGAAGGQQPRKRIGVGAAGRDQRKRHAGRRRHQYFRHALPRRGDRCQPLPL